jgi:hypothetical protein
LDVWIRRWVRGFVRLVRSQQIGQKQRGQMGDWRAKQSKSKRALHFCDFESEIGTLYRLELQQKFQVYLRGQRHDENHIKIRGNAGRVRCRIQCIQKHVLAIGLITHYHKVYLFTVEAEQILNLTTFSVKIKAYILLLP